MLRYFTAGESHGPALTAIIEGIPAGMELSAEFINKQLWRRQQGYGRGGRMKIEQDQVRILSGVRNGFTLGSPITLQIENRDWSNWEKFMSSTEADMDTRRVSVPRPGHGDLAGVIKYNHPDIRNILERASARETAARVAICTVTRCFLEHFGIDIYSHVTQIADVIAPPASLEQIKAIPKNSELACWDPLTEQAMKETIDKARENGDSLGGIFEIIVTGVPIGLGSHVHWDRKLDGRLAGALMSVQAIKGVEIGAGFLAAQLPGSQVHDAILFDGQKYLRTSNNAGGIEAGISNGQPLIVRAAMKPIATLYNPLNSVDINTKKTAKASIERSDICAVPAAAVVGEAVVAFEIAQVFLEKFGGDHMQEIAARFKLYQEGFSNE